MSDYIGKTRERQYLYFAKAELLWKNQEGREASWGMLMKAIRF